MRPPDLDAEKIASLIRSAIASGNSFADAVIAQRHILDQVEIKGRICLGMSAFFLDKALEVIERQRESAELLFGLAIEGLRKLDMDEDIVEILDMVTERTRDVRERNLEVVYMRAIAC